MIGVLTSLLSGATFGKAVPTRDQKDVRYDNGHFFQALSVEAFMDPKEFRRLVDRTVREMKESELAEGVERIYLPGEPELLLAKERASSGVPVSEAVDRELREVSGQLGVAHYPTI